MNIGINDIREDIARAVKLALQEDVQTGDITSLLIKEEHRSLAEVMTRESCVVCGIEWVNQTFKQLDLKTPIHWNVRDGDQVEKNTILFYAEGNTRTLLTGERTALNFLQLLSGIATKSKKYSDLVSGTEIKILDTRKTLPGLRTAQKYAVNCGGCQNHRIGLYDAFLIKENHISACGSIANAIQLARKVAPGIPIEVEVETIEQLKEAIAETPDIIMLDNFSSHLLQQITSINKPSSIKYEISGNIDLNKINDLRNAPIDYISTGDLTKNCTAIDMSLRISDIM